MSVQSTKRFYNFYSFIYCFIDIFLLPQKRKMALVVNRQVQGNLLEIGVGTGSHINLYRNQTLYAIDLSENMIFKAVGRNRVNSHFSIMQGEQLGFKSESFDAVVLSHVLSVVDDTEALIQEVSRVLKPSGLLFVLNHFSPDKHWSTFIYKHFLKLSQLLHFKIDFKQSQVKSLGLFDKQNEQGFGKLSIKLLTFKKK